MKIKQLLRDEEGKLSTARTAFWLILVFDIIVVTWDMFSTVPASSQAFALLTTLSTFLIVWAAGPRMAQYLAPQISKSLQAVKGVFEREADTRHSDVLARHGVLPEGAPDDDFINAAEEEDDG